ncbi:hypothetical protein TNIN_66041 [Trichonephila inaurata madagascariensis]|uniref:Uncharacterized protein n=1 Tax=Trichonephila inaurata madagascariensis TaxID=2747483 RepID=A0A8X6XDX5_9ARAC|nr:hypothetical protein TNIN_66041 [Trichonephila inaurata madagascariensis]
MSLITKVFPPHEADIQPLTIIPPPQSFTVDTIFRSSNSTWRFLYTIILPSHLQKLHCARILLVCVFSIKFQSLHFLFGYVWLLSSSSSLKSIITQVISNGLGRNINV